MTPRGWYASKRKAYLKLTEEDWDHVPLEGVYETLMRIRIEKRYFGLTTLNEDIDIANAVLIRDYIKRYH